MERGVTEGLCGSDVPVSEEAAGCRGGMCKGPVAGRAWGRQRSGAGGKDGRKNEGHRRQESRPVKRQFLTKSLVLAAGLGVRSALPRQEFELGKSSCREEVREKGLVTTKEPRPKNQMSRTGFPAGRHPLPTPPPPARRPAPPWAQGGPCPPRRTREARPIWYRQHSLAGALLGRRARRARASRVPDRGRTPPSGLTSFAISPTFRIQSGGLNVGGESGPSLPGLFEGCPGRQGSLGSVRSPCNGLALSQGSTEGSV